MRESRVVALVGQHPDKRAFYEARSATEAASIRPRARTFIIPDRCHRGGGEFVWDLRPLLQAMAKGEEFSHVKIEHIDDSASISTALNTEALQARMAAAGVEDKYGIHVRGFELRSPRNGMGDLLYVAQGPRRTERLANKATIYRSTRMQGAHALVRRTVQYRALPSAEHFVSCHHDISLHKCGRILYNENF